MEEEGIDGWRDASETMNVTTALKERDRYSDSEIENYGVVIFFRVLDQVQEIAAKLQAEEL